MNLPLRVLIVEDSKDDVDLLLNVMRDGGYDLAHEVVATGSAMRAALERQDWDVITSDHSMPRFSAPAALALAKELRPDVPFIIVSGEIDLNLAVALMKGGGTGLYSENGIGTRGSCNCARIAATAGRA